MAPEEKEQVKGFIAFIEDRILDVEEQLKQLTKALSIITDFTKDYQEIL